MGEFELIQRYFNTSVSTSSASIDSGVALGIGDDAALINVPADQQLVTSVDTLHGDVHFFSSSSPESIAQRALATNLSDMAAMGAEPRWCLLSLSLPESFANLAQGSQAKESTIKQRWLNAFSQRFASILKEYKVYLIGGDTTQAQQLSISITLMGLVPHLNINKAQDNIPSKNVSTALTRCGAQSGDDLYVSGFLGDAAAGLVAYKQQPDESAALQQRFLFPQARVALGLDLRGLANSCIDVSDGLLADAGHIAQRSQCAIEINTENLLASPNLKNFSSDRQQQLEYITSGGDDYELLFSAAPAQRQAIEALAVKHQIALTRIAQIKKIEQENTPSVVCVDKHKQVINFRKKGYEHFVKH